MQIHRFFTERTKLRLGSSVRILDDEAFHIRKSLRMQPDDEILLFNGENEYKARLKVVSKEVVMAEITEMLGEPKKVKGTKEFTLIQGLIRAANFELILQKNTELGVANIIPLLTEFSQIDLPRVDNKLDRWRKIVLEAVKQSERPTIPEVKEPLKFTDLPTIRDQFDLIILFTLPRPQVTAIKEVVDIHDLSTRIQTSNKIAYLIGPEGGFSPQEHTLAAEMGIPFVTIGGHILKAETAAMACQSVLNYIAG